MRSGSLQNCRAWPRSLGLALQLACLALTGTRPHAPSTDSINSRGTGRRGSIGCQRIEGRRNRGLTPAFRPSRAIAPLREENDGGPRSGLLAFLSLDDVLLVGPRGFPWTHRRGASNPLLQPTFRSRAPAAKTPSSETARRAPWENPPAFRFEILLARGVAAVVRGGRRTTSRSSGLQRLRA